MPDTIAPPERECYRCRRRGTRRYAKDDHGWRCTAGRSCIDRRLRRGSMLADARKMPTAYLPGDAPVLEVTHA